MHSICQFTVCYSHFQVSFGQMTCLPGHFRSPEVTWRHFLSHDCLLLWASLVGNQTHTIRRFAAFYSHFQVTSAEMTSLPVTSGHLRSRDVISCHVTASSCELQPCRKSNPQYTPVFGLIQPLPGNFRSIDDTSGSLLVTCSHVTSFPVTWLPPSANYSLVRSQTHIIRQFSAFYNHFQVTSGQMTSLSIASRRLSSRDIISCHVTDSYCELQPCMKSKAQYTRVSSLLQPLPGDFR